ncbi:MAG: hypothetical protein N5P05_003980 [Chroococcopsis gigantea SAG 12.99]|jgi:hypothetical protein|nr:hypothetical protein [Chroococcopsis gigantea SAG 12.99]
MGKVFAWKYNYRTKGLKVLLIAFSALVAIIINATATPPIPLSETEARYLNYWTPQLESEFTSRARIIISYYANPKSYGNAWGENEKQSYPRAMFDFLAGNRQKALAFLQQDDPQTKDQAHTDGIDYYFCFTLKGQIRKYFLLGPYLDPIYRGRMYNAAKIWTAEDPLQRPHPIYGRGENSANDWDMKRRGLWVDGRNTDNLRAMRETSVYLMAEETGNENTRSIYKAKIKRYVHSLYGIGMGEWDSIVYHGHTFAAYLNLYDFAKDPEVKQWAKAALDWMSTAAALKYYRGGWGGPVKRDYGGADVAMAGDAARTFWLYFGDTPVTDFEPSRDTLYMITSRYRPPLAVMELAHKQFHKPVEIFATKPLYENWKPGKDRSPGYWETQILAHNYQMGSLAAPFADGDVSPFKLMSYNSKRGVDFFVVNTGDDRLKPGKNPGDEIGQAGNLLIWLRPADKSFFFQLPKSSIFERESNIWFVRLEKTWLAIYPINLQFDAPIDFPDKRRAKKYENEQIYRAVPTGGSFSGFALEVSSQDSYEHFKEKNIRKSKLDISKLDRGKVIFQGTSQNALEFVYNKVNLLPTVKDNNKLRDWSIFDLYKSSLPLNEPINLGWKQGKLEVRTKNHYFTKTLQ